MATKQTIFSWGYYGWGAAPSQFVKAVDAVEAARNFDPPLFVDIRIRRAVRAKGFVGNAFASATGPERSEWMKGLGNLNIVTKEGPMIQIANPADANILLGHTSAQARRRVIYFCSCKWPLGNPPVDAGGPAEPCHRHEVGRLLLELAGRATPPANVEVVEWPGGMPTTEVLARPGSRLGRFRGRKSIELGEAMPPVRWCGLPWGSTVEVRCDDGTLHVVSGPASFQKGKWVLPVLGTGSSPDDCLAKGVEIRKDHGLDPL